MPAILMLLLLFPNTAAAQSYDYCADIAEVLAEGVREQIINEQEADEIIARCARAPGFEQDSP